MTAAEIIRNAIPGADESLCDHILWGRTPFPMGRVTAKDLYQAAARVRRAGEHGIRLCEMCDRIATPNDYTCQVCRDGLSANQGSNNV